LGLVTEGVFSGDKSCSVISEDQRKGNFKVFHIRKDLLEMLQFLYIVLLTSPNHKGCPKTLNGLSNCTYRLMRGVISFLN